MLNNGQELTLVKGINQTPTQHELTTAMQRLLEGSVY
jgi:hypothetical protein